MLSGPGIGDVHSARLHAAALLGMVGFLAIVSPQETLSARSANVDIDGLEGQRVETTAGPIRGALTPTTVTYLGIPYAEPPIGHLRWRPPEPHRPWHSPRDATRFGSHCLQATATSKQRHASEDCLFLNVYVPRVRPDRPARLPWPVMVWIHGGANAVFASEEYDPTPLVETGDGVIVVTLNYRLGPFGFLAHPALDAEDHLAVNYGILDQQLALKWVRANIARFGGDAHNVTIFGESAGGMDLLTQLASPLSAGLFDKAIIQSGAYRLDTPSLAESEKLGIAFANRAGCSNQTDACLRALPAATVIAQGLQVDTPQAAYNQSTVDGKILPESQQAALQKGHINKVPVLQGNNSDEGPESQTLTRSEYRTGLRSMAEGLGKNPDRAFEVYSLQRYASPAAAWRAAVGDAYFACSAQASNHWLSKLVPTYAYEFGGESVSGAHGAEQRYLMNIKNDDPEDHNIDPADAKRTAEIAANSKDGGPDKLPARDRRLSEFMRSAWTAFARSGRPATSENHDWPNADNAVQILQPLLPGPMPSSELRARHNCEFWDPAPNSQ